MARSAIYTEVKMLLGENIYKYRTQRGMSQGALADALEVSRQSVSKWENNAATPELDKLIKMSKLFDVTLDELVYGKNEEKPVAEPTAAPSPLNFTSPRFIIGLAMLLFGMIFFLLSVFWGDKIALGEEFGELLSISIVLVSISMIAPYNKYILATCSIIYFLYSVVSVGILHVTSITNYAFMFLASFVILIWFIIWGTKSSKEAPR